MIACSSSLWNVGGNEIEMEETEFEDATPEPAARFRPASVCAAFDESYFGYPTLQVGRRLSHPPFNLHNCHHVYYGPTKADRICAGNSSPLGSISEETTVLDGKQTPFSNFPTLRLGEWSDIGGRPYMEDTHTCITDLGKKFGSNSLVEEVVSFYGVFDGHGGKGAAHFVRDHLPRAIVEDADFPLELEKVVTKSFVETDIAFAKKCSIDSSLSSGTTALTAIIFGRSLLVANVGDCRAVLSRSGNAVEMSKDHRPCCIKERTRIEALGGYIDDGYVNGQLGVTRAFGDWHLEGMKGTSEKSGPLIAEPEVKVTTLMNEDEFLIIGSDGIWDVFTSHNAVDFARKRLKEHNDVRLCCKQVVEEAIKRGAVDNLTVVMVSFQLEPPLQMGSCPRAARVRRSISAEGLQNLKCLLEGQNQEAFYS